MVVLAITAVSLNVVQYDRHLGPDVEVQGLRRVYNKPRATINVSPRLPFDSYETDRDVRDEAATDLLQCRSDSASVDLLFRSPASGVLVAATMACAMLSALIWLAAESLSSIDRQTFSAVLLVFPAILAAYLLRPGEHDFARRLLVGVRLCGLGVAVCSVAVAALLGTTAQVAVPEGPSGSTMFWAHLFAVSASVMTGVLLLGFLRTWLWSDVRNRGKTEEGADFPVAPGIGGGAAGVDAVDRNL